MNIINYDEVKNRNIYRSGYLEDVMRKHFGNLMMVYTAEESKMTAHDLFCLFGMAKDELLYRTQFDFQLSNILDDYAILRAIFYNNKINTNTEEYKIILNEKANIDVIVANYVLEHQKTY